MDNEIREKMKKQILSFGEIQEPHTCVTIAYAGVRVESKKMYKTIMPTDAYQKCIEFLQEQAAELNTDGVKNIDIKCITSHDENGEEVIDFIAQGTLIKLTSGYW